MKLQVDMDFGGRSGRDFAVQDLRPWLSIIFGVQDKGFIERLLVEELDKLCTLGSRGEFGL